MDRGYFTKPINNNKVQFAERLSSNRAQVGTGQNAKEGTKEGKRRKKITLKKEKEGNAKIRLIQPQIPRESF